MALDTGCTYAVAHQRSCTSPPMSEFSLGQVQADCRGGRLPSPVHLSFTTPTGRAINNIEPLTDRSVFSSLSSEFHDELIRSTMHTASNA